MIISPGDLSCFSTVVFGACNIHWLTGHRKQLLKSKGNGHIWWWYIDMASFATSLCGNRITLVQNLPLTLKLKFCFSLARTGQAKAELLFWSQQEVLNKCNCHPVFGNQITKRLATNRSATNNKLPSVILLLLRAGGELKPAVTNVDLVHFGAILKWRPQNFRIFLPSPPSSAFHATYQYCSSAIWGNFSTPSPSTGLLKLVRGEKYLDRYRVQK